MSTPEKDAAFRPKARRPRGFQDRRGPSLAAERELVAKISKVYEAWGFEALETGAFEYADALGKFLPDQDRPNEGVFALEDDDSQWMALRYDLTAPLARFVAENFDALPKPYRRWAAGPVWRNEKPGPGRFREFWQCDADTVGSASPAADAEMIAMACEAYEAVGLSRAQYRINVSDRRIVDSALDLCIERSANIVSAPHLTRMRVLRAIDKWDRLGDEGVRALLGKGRKDESGDFTPGAELPDEVAFALMNVLSNPGSSKGGRPQKSNVERIDFLESNLNPTSKRDLVSPAMSAVADLRVIERTMSALGVPDSQWRIDTSIVRGLEYYTGAVFEGELLGGVDEDENAIRFGSIGGGGRYDDLVARFTGQFVPATGFSIGVSRLAAALKAADKSAVKAGPVVILALDRDRMADYFDLAARLRSDSRFAKLGVGVEVYLGSGKGPKNQLKYANKRNAPVAIIEWDEERAKGIVKIKDMRLGSQWSQVAGSDRDAWKDVQEHIEIEAPRSDFVKHVVGMLKGEGDV